MKNVDISLIAKFMNVEIEEIQHGEGWLLVYKDTKNVVEYDPSKDWNSVMAVVEKLKLHKSRNVREAVLLEEIRFSLFSEHSIKLVCNTIINFLKHFYKIVECPKCGEYYTYDIGYNVRECSDCHNTFKHLSKTL